MKDIFFFKGTNHPVKVSTTTKKEKKKELCKFDRIQAPDA